MADRPLFNNVLCFYTLSSMDTNPNGMKSWDCTISCPKPLHHNTCTWLISLHGNPASCSPMIINCLTKCQPNKNDPFIFHLQLKKASTKRRAKRQICFRLLQFTFFLSVLGTLSEQAEQGKCPRPLQKVHGEAAASVSADNTGRKGKDPGFMLPLP